MEKKLSKRFEGSVISLLDKYRTNLFFRTTCHIIVLQIILTTIVVIGLWFMMQYLVKDTSETLVSAFTQMLQGQSVTADNISENLENVRMNQFWPAMIIAIAVIISFGFVMVYVALTPARQALERKKRFISNIAHELRTPLAIMRTNTDVALLHEDMSQRLRNTLKSNIVEFDRVAEIMNNLLSLSNLTRDEYPRFEDVDLNIVARRAIDTLVGTIDNKDILLTFKSHTKQMVLGNAIALEQVVFNLLKNAIAHTKKKGDITVKIELAPDDKYINLIVSDTGSGIAREDLFHIFEPFYRARTSPRNGGQGLGLAIVNEIVQMHRGKIGIRSTKGRGTTVTVSIRRSAQDVAVTDSEDSNTTDEISVDFSHRVL